MSLSKWVSVIAVVALLFPAAGCKKGRISRDKVVNVSSDDPKMNAAIAQARQTVGEFIAALARPGPNQKDFAVKLPISDRGQVEHFWANNVRFDGRVFHATLNNDPDLVQNVKLGDPVTIERERISDWMYVDNGVLVGGYTIRVLRDAMSVRERRDFDRELPFKIR